VPLEELERYRQPIVRWVQRLKALRSMRTTAKLPIFSKSYRNPVAHALWWSAIMGSKAAPTALQNLPMPRWAPRAALESSPWLWKSIESLGRLGALARTIQGCRAILLIRHPCGVVSSILRGESARMLRSEVSASEDYDVFRLLSDTSEAQSHGLTLRAFFEMSPIERLTWRWALTNEKAMNDTSALSNVLWILYEDLCDEPVAVSRKIYEFCGLEWHPQVERFLAASISTNQSAYYGVVKDPRHAATKWMKELRDTEVRCVMNQASRTAPGKLFRR
jgi:hypothetical protein